MNAAQPGTSAGKVTAAELIRINPVIPVVVLAEVAHAVPLAEAFLAGGVRVLELTLRTAAGLAAIEAIADRVPDMVIGAGTILGPADAARAVAAGAQFLVSPGSPAPVLQAMIDTGAAVLPGAATVTEVMALALAGLTEMKFFPAATAGGPEYLKAVAGPLPHISFCPTGGITPATAAGYLALPSVQCVGGSWLSPVELLAARDWPAITALAAATRNLGREDGN